MSSSVIDHSLGNVSASTLRLGQAHLDQHLLEIPTPVEQSSCPARNNDQPTFLGVPLEVRERIYSYLAPRATSPDLCSKSRSKECRKRENSQESETRKKRRPENFFIAILIVNRQVYNEVLPFFYKCLDFERMPLRSNVWQKQYLGGPWIEAEWGLMMRGWIEWHLEPYSGIPLLRELILPFAAGRSDLAVEHERWPPAPYTGETGFLAFSHVPPRSPDLRDSLQHEAASIGCLIARGFKPRKLTITCHTDNLTEHTMCGHSRFFDENDYCYCVCTTKHKPGAEGCVCLAVPTMVLVQQILLPLQPLDDIVIDGREVFLPIVEEAAAQWGMEMEVVDRWLATQKTVLKRPQWPQLEQFEKADKLGLPVAQVPLVNSPSFAGQGSIQTVAEPSAEPEDESWYYAESESGSELSVMDSD